MDRICHLHRFLPIRSGLCLIWVRLNYYPSKFPQLGQISRASANRLFSACSLCLPIALRLSFHRLPGFLDVVKENAVAHAGRLSRAGHLESNEPAIVAHHRVGCLVAGIIAEIRQPLIGSALVEPELLEVNVAGTLVVLFIALHQRVLAVGINALWLIVLAWRVRVIDHLLSD